MVYGNIDDDHEGFAQLKADALERAADLADQLSEELQCRKCGAELGTDIEDPYIAHLRAAKSAYQYRADAFDKEIRLYTRLTDAQLMGEAFHMLSEEFKDDYSWPLFADAAINARMNFKEYRRLERKAMQLAKSISLGSAALAKLIRELQETGVGLPTELMPVLKEDAYIGICGPSAEAKRLQIRRLLEAKSRERQGAIVAVPDIVSNLLQVSTVANELKPDLMSAAIRFATSTRQNSKKTSYIRAFAVLLREVRIDTTPVVQRAMAVTGNVIFDDSNMDITEDDVRKALSQRGRGRQVRQVETSLGE